MTECTGFVYNEPTGGGDFGGVEMNDTSTFYAGTLEETDKTKLFFAGTTIGTGRDFSYNTPKNDRSLDLEEVGNTDEYVVYSPKLLSSSPLNLTFLNNVAYAGLSMSGFQQLGKYMFVIKGLLL